MLGTFHYIFTPRVPKLFYLPYIRILLKETLKLNTKDINFNNKTLIIVITNLEKQNFPSPAKSTSSSVRSHHWQHKIVKKGHGNRKEITYLVRKGYKLSIYINAVS